MRNDLAMFLPRVEKAYRALETPDKPVDEAVGQYPDWVNLTDREREMVVVGWVVALTAVAPHLRALSFALNDCHNHFGDLIMETGLPYNVRNRSGAWGRNTERDARAADPGGEPANSAVPGGGGVGDRPAHAPDPARTTTETA